MGGTSTTPRGLSDRMAYRTASGTTFAHTATMFAKPRSAQQIHESVDPRRVNTTGWKGRECLDSSVHPMTIPVVVAFDETASMGDAPYILQQKLAELKGAIIRADLDDVQLCFAAYGDAQNDEVAPCQVGQFEGGIEMEDWLNNLFIEQQGGGNYGETSGLLLYFLAEHSKLDSLEKRGKKGYLILIGDERPLTIVTKDEIKTYIGDTVESDLSIDDVVARVQESYEVLMFLVNTGAAKQQCSSQEWTRLLGADNVISTQGLDNISEQIAMTIAVLEGTVDDLDEAIGLLTDAGFDPEAAQKAGSAIEPLIGRGSIVPTGTGTLPASANLAGVGTERL